MGFPFVTSVTGCDIRRHDNNVEFVCCVSVGGNAPAFTGGLTALNELRIRPIPPIITQPNRWAIPLPLPLETEVFDVDMLDGNTGALIALPANSILKARLLVNGFLALFLLDIPTLAETGLTNAWFGSVMDIDIVININIRGKYLCRALPK